MDSVECTTCQITMTSWSPAGSTVRYFQCPLCVRTYASPYDEVFRARAGARRVGVPLHQARPATLPMASRDDQQWAGVRLRATRWFSRLELEERSMSRALSPAGPRQRLGAPSAALVAARPARHR
jgi:hypothetical protein